MTGRRFAVLAGLVLLCVLALSIVRSPDGDAGPASRNDVAAFSGLIQVDAPGSVDAGDAPDIKITSPAPEGSLVELYVVGAVDTQRLVTTLRNQTATLRVPATATEHAGELLLVARIGDAMATTQMRSEASTATDPVVPLVGPRTVIADDQDITMVVLLPADEFGNPVADDTDVVVSLIRPGGREQRVTVPVDGGVAASLVQADTVAGRVLVSAEVNEAGGPSHSFDQVAGQPDAFSLSASTNPQPRDLVADGFSLHPIETAELTDVFGNVLPDGVAVEFVVDGAEGRSLVSSTVQAGRSRTLIAAPAVPGEITVTARVSGRESTPLVLGFVSSLASGRAELVADTVRVGPVLGLLGGYVTDGTMVTVATQGSGEIIASGSLLAGETTILLPLGAPTTNLVIRVLGAELVVEGS